MNDALNICIPLLFIMLYVELFTMIKNTWFSDLT